MEDATENVLGEFTMHCDALRTQTDVKIMTLLKKSHQSQNVTLIRKQDASLIEFADAGLAEYTTSKSCLGYRKMAVDHTRKMLKTLIQDHTIYSVYEYKWQQQTFTLYYFK